MKPKYYVTTAIAYVNGKPHIGHALEFLQADFVARYHRFKGEDVYFLTGTDEHGQKIVEMAKQQGMSTKRLVNQNAKIFIDFTKLLNLSNDDFIRTSDQKKHWPSVVKLWNILKDKGDIYKKYYEGLYCVGCEKFMTKKELDGLGNCPVHEKAPKTIKEENYFFNLSKYASKVKELIEKDKFKVAPKTRKNEILSFLSGKVEDISFSRNKKSLSWGIPVPGDEKQVMYVWSDALTNYISALDFSNNGRLYKKFWPADAHIIGKDILRFHAAYWPAMLLSAKVQLPKVLFVHGFITVNGQKMSKSLGNIVDPCKQIEKFGLEAVRLYLMKEISDSDDGNYSEDRLVEMINNELADDLGNLVRRVTVLIEKNFSGRIPNQGALKRVDKKLIKQSSFAKEFDGLMLSFEFNKAIELLWNFIRTTNKYLTETEPWKIENKIRLGTVLYNALEAVRIIALYLSPVIPTTADKILDLIGQKLVPYNKASFNNKTTGKVKLGKVLFKKVIVDDLAVDPFSKLDLRVAEIIKVDKHPDADKLYVLQIDFGSEKKQMVSGLVDNYKAKDLLGKKVIAVFNLKPAKFRGIESNGMLLAAEDKKKVVVLEAEKAKLGSKVFINTVVSKPSQVISIDEFFKAKMIANKSKAYYNGEELKVKSGLITVKGVIKETSIC